MQNGGGTETDGGIMTETTTVPDHTAAYAQACQGDFAQLEMWLRQYVGESKTPSREQSALLRQLYQNLIAQCRGKRNLRIALQRHLNRLEEIVSDAELHALVRVLSF